MKRHILAITLTTATLLLTAAALRAEGPLAPPAGAPAPTMKSLQEIYDKICDLETKSNTLETAINTQDSQLIQLGLINSLFVEAGVINMSWKVHEPVDDNGDNRSASLAFSPSGQPAIAYYDINDPTPGLKYALFNGTTWSFYTFTGVGDASGVEGAVVSLVFTPQGNPAIAFYDPSDESLKYAAFKPFVGWQVSTVRSAPASGLPTGTSASMDFSPAGFPWIFYTRIDLSNQYLSYSEFDGTSWTHHDLVSTPHPNYAGKYSAFKFTPDGRPAVAYEDASIGVGRLKYAERDSGGTWQFIIVDLGNDTGPGVSLAFTPQRWPAISYHDPSPGMLSYAEYDGNLWNLTTVASTPTSTSQTSLAFTPGGRPAIGYSSDGLVYYAVYDGTSWNSTSIDGDFFYNATLGSNSALKFTPSGQPAMAFLKIYSNGLSLTTKVKYTVRGPFTSP